MKIRFYLGILLAVIIGWTFANGIAFISKGLFHRVTGEFALVLGSTKLSANVVSGGEKLSNLKIIEVQGDDDFEEYASSEIGLYYTYPNSGAFPNISAEAYLVADLDTGQIIKEQNIESQYPIASLTKLITALTSLETLTQSNITSVSPSAFDTYGDQGNLQPWQKISIADLLYPLLLESSNDAAEVLAEYAGRNIFMSNLNGVAKSIGMEDTQFVDPSGLSPQNISTIKDLFRLMQYLHKTDSEILEITKMRDYRDEDNFWSNLSDFRNDANYLGGKNGYTDEALHTLISSFALPLSEDDGEQRNIVIILLRSDNTTEEDTRDIIYWLLRDIYYE